MLKKLLIAGMGVAALLVAGVAMAGVPCAGTSVVDVSVGHLTGIPTSCTSTEGAFCPQGDMDTVLIVVTINDCYGNALAGRTVTFDMPGAPFIIEDPPGPAVTDAFGQVSAYCVEVGGCGFAQYGATCETVGILGNLIYQASFDNDSPANGDVGLSDFARFSSHFGTTNACSDYDCDGTVGLGDFAKFSSHFGHT